MELGLYIEIDVTTKLETDTDSNDLPSLSFSSQNRNHTLSNTPTNCPEFESLNSLNLY